MLQGNNPYFKEHRLSDVINAIQAMGTVKNYARPIKSWQKAMGDKPKSCSKWKKVFKQHPEFFGHGNEDNGKGKKEHRYWLRVRRAKAFDQEENRERNNDSYHEMVALEPSERESLVKAAIDLHARSGELFITRRWLVSPILSFLGTLLGAFIAIRFQR
jgi:hypothetical protein